MVKAAAAKIEETKRFTVWPLVRVLLRKLHPRALKPSIAYGASRPLHQRRQRGQDRLDIAAGAAAVIATDTGLSIVIGNDKAPDDAGAFSSDSVEPATS